MPPSHVRLSAGREAMSDEMQALCFLAGANSIFYGEKLLTTGNPDVERDQQLFARLGLKPERLPESQPELERRAPRHEARHALEAALAELDRQHLTRRRRRLTAFRAGQSRATS